MCVYHILLVMFAELIGSYLCTVYANRDKILLDGGADDSDSDGLEDEVFALKGLDRDIEEENLEDHDYSDEEDPSLSEPGPSKATKTKAKKKEAKGKKAAAPSASSESEESEEESWGQKKSAYYSSNADRIDSEDEEANELEEQEALRLQSKARETLNDDAFGLPDHLDDLEPSRQEEEEEDSLVNFTESTALTLTVFYTARSQHMGLPCLMMALKIPLPCSKGSRRQILKPLPLLRTGKTLRIT